jgi:hypothetical protein
MAKLSMAWDGMTVEYLQSEPVSPGVVVSLAIAHQPIDSSLLTGHLHLIVHPSAIVPNTFNYSQTVSDPVILHLLQLLQTEMQTPQAMSQLFVSSIVTVITTYLFHNSRLD